MRRSPLNQCSRLLLSYAAFGIVLPTLGAAQSSAETSGDRLDACKGGKLASSNFDYSARLTEIVLLGNVALRVGKKITWDGPNLKATNAPEAEQFIKGTYRSGWEIG